MNPNWLHPDLGLKVFIDAHDTVTVEEGERYPLGPPTYAGKVFTDTH